MYIDCENTTSEIQIKTTILQLDHGKELDASIRGSLALVNIAENYPPERHVHTSIQMVQQPRQLQTAALVSSSGNDIHLRAEHIVYDGCKNHNQELLTQSY